jgi:hypothetical protein
MPPLVALQGNVVVTPALVNYVDTSHVSLVFQENRRSWEINSLPPDPPWSNTVGINGISGSGQQPHWLGVHPHHCHDSPAAMHLDDEHATRGLVLLRKACQRGRKSLRAFLHCPDAIETTIQQLGLQGDACEKIIGDDTVASVFQASHRNEDCVSSDLIIFGPSIRGTEVHDQVRDVPGHRIPRTQELGEVQLNRRMTGKDAYACLRLQVDSMHSKDTGPQSVQFREETIR